MSKANKIITSADLREDIRMRPDFYRATTVVKWNAIVNALERILEKSEVRCGHCMIQLQADGDVFCDDCSLFKSGICGYKLRPGRLFLPSEEYNSVQKFSADFKRLIKLAQKIRDSVQADAVAGGGSDGTR